jgi:hypothetical protein
METERRLVSERIRPDLSSSAEQQFGAADRDFGVLQNCSLRKQRRPKISNYWI